MEDETFECFEATFYRNTLQSSLPEIVKAGLALEDGKTLEKYLNQAMMEKDGILGVHYGNRADGTVQTYMDYFMVKDEEATGASGNTAGGEKKADDGDNQMITENEAVEQIEELWRERNAERRERKEESIL